MAAIEKQMKLASCSCSDHNGKCCLALFTVGEVVDIRLQRKYLGYAEEKALRSIELKRALEMQHATGSNKLRVTVSGKQLCLQGYILVSVQVPQLSTYFVYHIVLFSVSNFEIIERQSSAIGGEDWPTMRLHWRSRE